MPKLKSVALGATLSLSLLCAGCSSSPSAPNSTPTTTAPPSGTSSTTPVAAVNLVVTGAVRTQLIAAVAAQIHVAASEYTGLAPGLTYYALDKTTDTYWAGAKLVPAPSSDPNNPTAAQVASQDEGAYNVFSEQKGGGTWTVYETGNAGQGANCSVTIPAEILQVWGWAPGSCRPAGA